MDNKQHNKDERGNSTVNTANPKKDFTPREKSSLGGAFNSGMKSNDPIGKRKTGEKRETGGSSNPDKKHNSL